MNGKWVLAALAAACACKPGTKSGSAQNAGGAPAKVATLEGFLTPESVKWDSAQDVYFVSNINGAPSAKDGNGYITARRCRRCRP